MNQDVFFKNFELLADAPNGIKKLRELILRLAIRGKLVPQDQNDESASILIKKIQKEKNRSVNGTVAQSKSQSRMNINNVPYDLPINWKWVSFGDVVVCRDGERIPVARSERENREKVYDYYGASGVIDKIDNYLFDKPLLLIGEDGANLLNRSTPIAFIAKGKYWVNNHAHVIDGISLDFLRYLEVFINAIDLSPYVTGSAQPKMNQAKMNSIPIAIPPLAEQKRIVSKVDELMFLCDKLEARRQKKQELQSKLNSAALDRMLSAENKEEFEQHWQRICENFDLLYDNPENVEKLRQAILQLAVQGKLVEQNPEDESASILIEKIEAEKRQLVKEGKIQKTKELQSVDIEEIPYSIPDDWLWTRFGNIAPYIEAGWSPMCEKRPKEGDEWGVLKISAVSWNAFNPSENKALPSNLKPKPEYEVKLNDFLMSRANTSELVGKSVIVEDIIPKLMICDKVLRLFFSSFGSKKFYNIFNNSQTARFYYAKEASGTSSSMKNISREVIYNMPVPLPPLNEQKRIVEKVEQLMGLCDELESKLRKSREDSEKLMEAVVKGLLEGAATEKTKLDKPIPLQVASFRLK